MQRVRIDPNSNHPLGPGFYELVYPVLRGDPSKVNKTQLESQIKRQLGSRVALLDWTPSNKSLTVQIEIKAAAPSTAAEVTPAFIPVAITLALIVSTLAALVVGWGLYLDKRPTAYQLLNPEQIKDVEKTKAVAGAAGLGALALIAFFLFWYTRRRA